MCLLPITDSGASVLRPGDEVYVISRSHRRGYLVVELSSSGEHLHVPHNYTELKVSQPLRSHSPGVLTTVIC